MKTLISTPNNLEAEQIKAALHDADIDAQILEVNNTSFAVTPDPANYSIIVADDDLDRANDVLRDYRAQNRQNETLPWCPECGSDDVSETIVRLNYGSGWFLILGFIILATSLNFPLPRPFGLALIIISIACIIQFFIGYKVHRFRCNKCNHIFRRY